MMLLLSMAMAQGVSGFAEVRLQGMAGIDADVPLFVVERVRPTFTAPLGKRINLTTTIEAGLSQGWRTSDAFANLAIENDLSPDLGVALGGKAYENKAFAVSDAADYLSVDRLALEVYLPFMDIRLGRQALNWGSGFAVNPSDPFPEVLLTEPWKPRSGVNALRVDIPFGELNALQLVVASNDAFTHPRFAARATVNVLDTDISLVGAYREVIDSGIVGLDIKGTLGVGFWFEGVVHVDGPATPYEELAVGLDYSFPVLDQFILTAQYYRNGSGNAGKGELSLFAERTPFAPTFTGRDYLMASASVGFTQDFSVSALWIQNLNDGTAYVVPTAVFLANNWLELSLAAQIPIALRGGGEFRPSSDQLEQQLPGADGTPKTVDLGGLVPEATAILWTRVTF